MFIVTNRIPVASGHEADFEDRFRNRAHLIDRSPGFIKNLVLRPVQRRFNHQTGQWEEKAEQGYYLVQTYWESEQAFWDWTKSESFRIAHSNRPPAEMFAGSARRFTNTGGLSVTQRFKFRNASGITSLLVHRTSSSENMAPQSDASVANNTFTYTLPAQSITTFHEF